MMPAITPYSSVDIYCTDMKPKLTKNIQNDDRISRRPASRDGFRCTAFHENRKHVQTACIECQPNMTKNMGSTDTRPFTPATIKYVSH
jgi:hypothetical protein